MPLHCSSSLTHTFRYAKLGLMGMTVVYASGDNGVAGLVGANEIIHS